MPANLREVALRQPFPVILTEGFGESRISEMVYNLLRSNSNRTAAIDAKTPGRWAGEPPIIAIPFAGNTKPPPPEVGQVLSVGMQVRVARAPYGGQSGIVQKLIDAPQRLENSLRLPGAEIRLVDGKIIFAPLANIEVLGRPIDPQSR
jgi:hypothetical protein